MDTRRWKCTDCGASVEVNYDWIAEHGNPYCPDCDFEMLLVPLDDEVGRLTQKASAAGLEDEDLDETAHELAARIAAEINNGGLEAQIGYLVEHLGPPGAETQLDQLSAEKTEPASGD